MKIPALAGLTLAAALTPLVLAAFGPGGAAYTNRQETVLLSEPKPLAATTARLPYGRKLKVEQVRGVWLRVSEGKAAGWVFSGNLSDEKPVEVQGLDGLPMLASETTATTAARPLAPAAVEYSARRGLAPAREDLQWLTGASDAITSAATDEFMREQKKGEFQ